MIKIPKIMIGQFYIWQESSYGDTSLRGGEPADIYRARPMPRTPAGDLVHQFGSATEAHAALLRLSPAMTAEEARAFLARAE